MMRMLLLVSSLLVQRFLAPHQETWKPQQSICTKSFCGKLIYLWVPAWKSGLQNFHLLVYSKETARQVLCKDKPSSGERCSRYHAHMWQRLQNYLFLTTESCIGFAPAGTQRHCSQHTLGLSKSSVRSKLEQAVMNNHKSSTTSTRSQAWM